MDRTNRRIMALFLASLIYIAIRYGLTINRTFVVGFLIAATVGIYYAFKLISSLLFSLKSAKFVMWAIRFYRRKLLIWAAISAIAFYGFYRTQLPGQIESYKAMANELYTEWTYVEDKPDFNYASAPDTVKFNTPPRERRLDEIALSSPQRNNKEMLKEITMGWNKTTADTENDNFNWEKATDLIKKYPEYILNATGSKVSASKALAEPWEYYGEVVRFRGQVYSIQQLPPENSVAQFFGGNCYHAMLIVKDKNKPVTISVYIVGNAEGVAEDSIISVKGYIYGQSHLTNSAGGVSNGIAFVGFKE